MERVIASLFPPDVAVAIWPPEEAVPELEGDELEAVRNAVPKRRLEFAQGRACARKALARLGAPAGPLPAGPAREPLWPDGVTGSITHCRGLVAAVVGPARSYHGLGVDAEEGSPLPPDVRSMVYTPADQRWLDEHRERLDETWDKVLFSAKESIYKAVYPTFGDYLDFLDVDLLPDLPSRTFLAGPSEDRQATFAAIARLRGRFEVHAGLVVTGVVLPA